MRFIKTYPTEDDFAAAENNSGYPENAVTSIDPGFAYVVETGDVYYNQEPYAPGIKFTDAISSVTWQFLVEGEHGWEVEEGASVVFPLPPDLSNVDRLAVDYREGLPGEDSRQFGPASEMRFWRDRYQ